MDTRASTSYHPLPNKLFNLTARVLNAVGIAKMDLSEDCVLAKAKHETQIDRFEDDSFLPALRILMRSLRTEAQLNPFGRFYARAKIVESLKNRLWADACFKAHPEIRERRITAPIIIIGPHRSGTTRLHRMMAADSRLQFLRTWEGINPAPRLDRPELGRTARYKEVRSFFRSAYRAYPGAFVGHPMDADLPEEEMLLLNHSFCSFSLLGEFNIPSYYDWFLRYDKTPAYRYMSDLMKLISWSRGDSEEKRWVLKNPQHMLDLDVLLSVFPDAKLVFTHRDPLKTVASIMSLMWHFAVQHTDVPCRAQVRDVWLDYCEQSARRCMQMRQNISAAQQIDVHYEDMNRDWRAVMRKIYDLSGIEFTSKAEQALGTWLTGSVKENRHGGHCYALEDFGITKQEVDTRMMDFREKYAISYEVR